MNWWIKIAGPEIESIRDKVTSFKDRNLVNQKISAFKKIVVELRKIVRGGHMDIPESREIVHDLSQDKRLSSYPKVQKLLDEAYRVALDSPNKFRGYCRDAGTTLYDEVKKMEDERKEFSQNTLPTRMKERFEHGKK